MTKSVNSGFMWARCLACLTVLLIGCGRDQSADSLAVKNVMSEYREAWKRGDQQAVLDKVSDDIVLHMPTTAGRPIAGKAAVSAFWFPASDVSYPITGFDVSNEEIEIRGDLAIYSGVSRLSWHTLRGEIRSDSSIAVSEFLNVLRREEGRWKLLRIMYNLKDSTYTGIR